MSCGKSCPVHNKIMSWSNREVRMLIEEVQKYPCLYVVKSANYKNKHAHKAALAEIVKTLMPLRSGITENDIKSKFNGLRSNFFTEHRKVIASQKSGAGIDEVYKPSLWYYDRFLFILQHCETRSAYDSLNESSQIENETNVESQEEELTEEEQVYTLDSETGILIPESNDNSEIDMDEALLLNTPKINSNTKRKRRNVNEENSEFFMESTKALQNLTAAMQLKRHHKLPDNKNQTLANYIVSKLAEIHDEIRVDIEMQIVNILFEGIKQSKNM